MSITKLRHGIRVGGQPTEATVSEVWLTEEQAAERLGFSAGTLRAWRGKEIGPRYRKVGNAENGRVRYPDNLLRQ